LVSLFLNPKKIFPKETKYFFQQKTKDTLGKQKQQQKNALTEPNKNKNIKT